MNATDTCLIDQKLAISAAETMAKTLKEDIAILKDLRVVPLSTTNEPPLEIIRCDPLSR